MMALCAVSVSGCTSNYASRKECERGESAYIGGAIGFLAGGAALQTGRKVDLPNGKTKSIGASSNLAMAGIGTLLGRGAGILYNEAFSSDEPDDHRPYVGDWRGSCRPSD
jgi:hypothetical protein